jgi:hypothetical protein
MLIYSINETALYGQNVKGRIVESIKFDSYSFLFKSFRMSPLLSDYEFS